MPLHLTDRFHFRVQEDFCNCVHMCEQSNCLLLFPAECVYLAELRQFLLYLANNSLADYSQISMIYTILHTYRGRKQKTAHFQPSGTHEYASTPKMMHMCNRSVTHVSLPAKWSIPRLAQWTRKRLKGTQEPVFRLAAWLVDSAYPLSSCCLYFLCGVDRITD